MFDSIQQEVIEIPKIIVKSVIGKNEEHLNRFRQNSNCKIEISYKGLPQGICKITGTEEGITCAIVLIQEFIETHISKIHNKDEKKISKSKFVLENAKNEYAKKVPIWAEKANNYKIASTTTIFYTSCSSQNQSRKTFATFSKSSSVLENGIFKPAPVSKILVLEKELSFERLPPSFQLTKSSCESIKKMPSKKVNFGISEWQSPKSSFQSIKAMPTISNSSSNLGNKTSNVTKRPPISSPKKEFNFERESSPPCFSMHEPIPKSPSTEEDLPTKWKSVKDRAKMYEGSLDAEHDSPKPTSTHIGTRAFLKVNQSNNNKNAKDDNSTIRTLQEKMALLAAIEDKYPPLSGLRMYSTAKVNTPPQKNSSVSNLTPKNATFCEQSFNKRFTYLMKDDEIFQPHVEIPFTTKHVAFADNETPSNRIIQKKENAKIESFERPPIPPRNKSKTKPTKVDSSCNTDPITNLDIEDLINPFFISGLKCDDKIAMSKSTESPNKEDKSVQTEKKKSFLGRILELLKRKKQIPIEDNNRVIVRPNAFQRVFKSKRMAARENPFHPLIEIREIQSKPSPSEKFECGICLEQFSSEEDGFMGCERNPFCHQFSQECHKICIDCLRGYAKCAIADAPVAHGGHGLNCVHPECENIYLLTSFEFYICQEDYGPLKKRLQEQCLADADLDDIVKCEECGLQGWKPPSSKYYICECGRQQCLLCNRAFDEKHLGKTCQQIEDEEASTRQLETQISEIIIRKCNKCGIAFIKDEGCNKMTCRCGAIQCYICNERNIDYMHFCQCGTIEQQHGKCQTCRKSCRLWEDGEELNQIQIKQLQQQQ